MRAPGALLMAGASGVASGRSALVVLALLGGAGTAAGLVGWFAFDAGLKRAGFSRTAAAGAAQQAAALIARLEAENKQLHERVAVLETAGTVDREAYRQVESQLIELQGKILAQQEDIEFYRGIVGADDGSRLRIQDFVVRPASRAGNYTLQLVLAQALRSRGDVQGRIRLAVEGQQNGAPARLDLPQLMRGDPVDELKYSFRYFQDLKVRVRLPEAFVPERVHVLVRPRGKNVKTVEEFFVWQPESS